MDFSVNFNAVVLKCTRIKSSDIKKTDDFKLEVLATENLNLVKTEFDGKSRTKQLINDKLKNYIDKEPKYLQQVYAKGEDNISKGNRDIDIVYLAIVPEDTQAKNGYKFCEVFCDEKYLIVDNKKFEYTLYQESSFSKEKYHNIICDDPIKKNQLLMIMLALKYIKNNIENFDILFEFLTNTFTLEQAHKVYVMLKMQNYDKSNFRKKFIPNCEKLDIKIDNQGFRPTYLYKEKQ